MHDLKDYASILRHHAAIRGEKVAIYHGDDQTTYALLEKKADRFACLLRSLGLKAGDRFVIALPDCPDFFHAFLGGLKHGAIPVLLGPDMPQKSYAYVFRDCAASALITIGPSGAVEAWAGQPGPLVRIDQADYADFMSQTSEFTPAHPREREVHFLVYSSGSTGEPKGIPHTQADMIFSAQRYAGQVLAMSAEDVVLSASKLNFSFGLGNSLFFPLYFGSSTVLNHEPSGPAAVFGLFQLLAKHRPTMFFAVPSVYNLMLKTLGEDAVFSSLRLCVSAGEALAAGIYRQWRQATGVEILDGIGSSEALHIYISNRPGQSAPGQTGLLVPGYEAKIIRDDGQLASYGEPGILHLRGESTATCYWNRPDLTAKAMQEGGWFNTGDVFVEDHGRYAYQGRKDDMFKAGGSWVAPVRVEEVLRDHPAVQECAVTSCNMEGLLAPIAHVVLGAGFENQSGLAPALRSFVLERLPGHMCPVRFIFTQGLPKTQTGKIIRSQLGDH